MSKRILDWKDFPRKEKSQSRTWWLFYWGIRNNSTRFCLALSSTGHGSESWGKRWPACQGNYQTAHSRRGGWYQPRKSGPPDQQKPETDVDYPRKIPALPQKGGSVCRDDRVTLIIHKFPGAKNLPGICFTKSQYLWILGLASGIFSSFQNFFFLLCLVFSVSIFIFVHTHTCISMLWCLLQF